MANSTVSTTDMLVLFLTVTADWSEAQGWSASRFASLQKLRLSVQRHVSNSVQVQKLEGVDSCLGVASNSSIFLRLGLVPEREPQPWLSEQRTQPVLSSVYFCCYLVSSLVLLFFVREFNTSQSTPSVSGYWRLCVHFVVFISLKPSGWQP